MDEESLNGGEQIEDTRIAEEVSEEKEEQKVFATDEEKLTEAERLIWETELTRAKELLDGVEDSAEKYFVLGEFYRQKKWVNEARKYFKKAIKADKNNEKYLAALDELESFKKSDEFKTIKKQMGGEDACLCGAACCECCGSGICEAICDGCS